jgi:hypothetical protein
MLAFNVHAYDGSTEIDIDTETPEIQKKIKKYLEKRIFRYKLVSDQKQQVDNIFTTIVRSISSNVAKILGSKNNDIFDRKKGKIELMPADNINDQMFLKVDLELKIGIVSQEIVDAIKRAFEESKNHCCDKLVKDITGNYGVDESDKIEGITKIAIEYDDIQIKDIEVPNVTKQQEEDFKAFVESLGLSM